MKGKIHAKNKYESSAILRLDLRIIFYTET